MTKHHIISNKNHTPNGQGPFFCDGVPFFCETPLQKFEGKWVLSKTMSRLGTLLGAKRRRDGSPLHAAAGTKKVDPSIIPALVKKGDDINLRDYKKETPLHDAVARGSLESVRSLLALGANPNIPNHNGKTPISFDQAGLRKCQLLVAYGATLNHTHMWNRPLWREVSRRKPKMSLIKFLLDHGAEISGRDQMGRDLFTLTVTHSHTEIRQLLEKTVYERRVAPQIALCMGVHARVGAGSPIRRSVEGLFWERCVLSVIFEFLPK
jgi:hypothetical protein